MRAVLAFALPREREEFRQALDGSLYLAALADLAMAFRAHRKYDAEPVTEERFFEILAEHGVEV